jgi:hypothetical protein
MKKQKKDGKSGKSGKNQKSGIYFFKLGSKG